MVTPLTKIMYNVINENKIIIINIINPLVAFYDIHGGKREVLF
jgi:hypothetical protein